jgi:hypothetical protein
MMEERRNTVIQLQRWVPQTATIVVSVPEGWTDDEVKAKLADIYEAAEVDSHEWCDMDDYDPREGEHEVSGEADPGMEVDLVYPPEEDDDADE